MALTKRLITINQGEKKLTFFVNLVNGTVSLTSVYNNIFTGQRTRHILKSAECVDGNVNAGSASFEDTKVNVPIHGSADIFSGLNRLSR